MTSVVAILPEDGLRLPIIENGLRASYRVRGRELHRSLPMRDLLTLTVKPVIEHLRRSRSSILFATA